MLMNYEIINILNLRSIVNDLNRDANGIVALYRLKIERDLTGNLTVYSSGKIYIDDIRLYQLRKAATE